jgi:hypothetical protein
MIMDSLTHPLGEEVMGCKMHSAKKVIAEKGRNYP